MPYSNCDQHRKCFIIQAIIKSKQPSISLILKKTVTSIKWDLQGQCLFYSITFYYILSATAIMTSHGHNNVKYQDPGETNLKLSLDISTINFILSYTFILQIYPNRI